MEEKELGWNTPWELSLFHRSGNSGDNPTQRPSFSLLRITHCEKPCQQAICQKQLAAAGLPEVVTTGRIKIELTKTFQKVKSGERAVRGGGESSEFRETKNRMDK